MDAKRRARCHSGRDEESHTAARLRRLTTIASLWLGLLAAVAGCRERPRPPTEAARRAPRYRSRARSPRAHAAAVTVRFSNSGVEPGSTRLGYDRLRVSAIFADADRRDSHLLGDLVGRALRGSRVQGEDSCVRTPGPWLGRTARPGPAPRAWLQLLDVGNLTLEGGTRRLPLRISLVPSLFSAVRGVRYDGDIDHSRPWLATDKLRLTATGGDGVAPFTAEVKVPRPVRLTHVGGRRVRAGMVKVTVPTVVGSAADSVNNKKPKVGNLDIRWGSVDGEADLEVLVGSEQGEGIDWLRCRLRDDGEFTVPAVLLETLPKRSDRQPWLVVLVRSRAAKVPGFPGDPLLLELVDSVRVR